MKKKYFIYIIIVLAIALVFFFSQKNQNNKIEKEYSNEVTVFNWGEYIDMDVLEQFEKETGYKVNYRVFSTNEEMYPKLVNGAENYDVIIPSDYMIQRLIEEDMLAEINMENVPNFKNIDDVLKNPSYDPENKYSVPYFWGVVGILYNEKFVEKAPDTWEALFDEKYKDMILMCDSERDSFMVALIRSGYSMNSQNEDEINQAKEMLIKQKPLVLAYVIDECADKMVSEEAALALTWSGEAGVTMEENENLNFALPKEGSNLWIDAMAIPKSSKNKKGAEAFINFMCRDDIALKNMEYTGYTSGNINVKDMIDTEWANSPAAYPPKDYVEKCEIFEYSPDNLRYIWKAWLEVKQK